MKNGASDGAIMTSSEKYKLTYILIAVNVAVYVYTSLIGGDALVTNFNPYNTQLIIQFNYNVFHGAYWQLFTSMFVHVSIVHLAGNMLFLVIFGLRGEEMFSLPQYLAVYLLSGLAGNLLSLIPLINPWIPSAGASGAIFGMFGACAIFARRSIGQSVIGAIIFGFFLLIISSGEGVNYLAHIGGLVAGLVVGYLLARTAKPQTIYQISYNYTTPF